MITAEQLLFLVLLVVIIITPFISGAVVVSKVKEPLDKLRITIYDRTKKSSPEPECNNNINFYLRGTINADSVQIEDVGEPEDKVLYIETIVNKIIERVNNVNAHRISTHKETVSILVFMSSILDVDEWSINKRMMHLLTIISLLDWSIVWVNDTYKMKDNDKALMLFKYQLRCDKLVNRKDITVINFEEYDIIFHPHAGIRSAYEIAAGVIKKQAAESISNMDL